MTGLARVVARMYPNSWRKRYGAELEALLEDSQLGWKDLADLAGGGLTMHFKTWSTAAVMAAAVTSGAILGIGLSFALPANDYRSTSVVKVEAGGATKEVANVVANTFSRRLLWSMIDKERLYEADKATKPAEDIVEQMRYAIRVHRVVSVGSGVAFVIDFTYPDAERTQRVTADLTRSLIDEATRAGVTLQILDPASRAVPFHRFSLAGMSAGLFCGLLFGCTMVLMRRRWMGPAA